MTALLRAELIKLRTTRTFLALAGLAVGLSLLIAVLTAVLGEPTKESVLVDVFAADLSSLFIMLLAIVGISGEWRHRTITSSLLAAPDRPRFLAAKTVAFAVTGILLSLCISAAVDVVAYTILTIRDMPVADTGDLLSLALRNAVVAGLLGAFGVGLGGLVRNQVVAVVGVLVAMLLVEPVVTSLLPEIVPYGPFTGLPTAIQGLPADAVGLGSEADLLPAVPAGLLLLTWIGTALAAAVVMLRRRDLN